ncbi:IS3 family transposase [Rice orange leaf phytoplasma]|uniref:IS3 family transposase n=1 Tax=Rice orange leaf phytoplasma TaxID=146897 RepID=UPI0008F59324|nr:IS3 family transposase [Rice orange leaf phytoplasma]OIJ45068.1 hypothetical protein BHE82_00725 [Rice orange leaf phytoplasma]
MQYYTEEMILNRQFLNLAKNMKATRPHQILCGGITEVYYQDKVLYVSVVLDTYSRKILAYYVSDYEGAPLIIDTIDKLNVFENDCIFHSYLKFPYYKLDVEEILETKNLIQSFEDRQGIQKGKSSPCTYLTSFFSSFKCECIYYGIPNPRTISKKVMIEAICKYMSYYNLERMHSSLNYATPDAFEKNILKS